jgi:hypothetical protein
MIKHAPFEYWHKRWKVTPGHTITDHVEVIRVDALQPLLMLRKTIGRQLSRLGFLSQIWMALSSLKWMVRSQRVAHKLRSLTPSAEQAAEQYINQDPTQFDPQNLLTPSSTSLQRAAANGDLKQITSLLKVGSVHLSVRCLHVLLDSSGQRPRWGRPDCTDVCSPVQSIGSGHYTHRA